MIRTSVLIAIAAILVGTAAGCGGGGNDTAADEQAIRDLVAQVNRASVDGDAEAACDAIAPSSLRQAFQTRARCVRETDAILKEAGTQPAVEVDSIEVDGDRATVTFKGRNGEIEVIREDGRWYIPIDAEQELPAEGNGE